MAIEDIAMATFAYNKALATGLGTRLDLEGAGEGGTLNTVPHLVAPEAIIGS
jgi:hypothetical protein